MVDAAVMILLKGETPNRITHDYLLNISRVNQFTIIVQVRILS